MGLKLIRGVVNGVKGLTDPSDLAPNPTSYPQIHFKPTLKTLKWVLSKRVIFREAVLCGRFFFLKGCIFLGAVLGV